MSNIKFGIEFIYAHVGQFDAYCSFDFHQDSAAFKKLGSHVHGFIYYTPTERKRLEQLSELEMSNNSGGIIKLDSGCSEKLVKDLLFKEGFSVSDISHFYSIGGTSTKEYGQSEVVKEIPNTINIDFEAPEKKWDDIYKMELNVFNLRIDHGTPLIAPEIVKYNALVYLLGECKHLPDELVNPSTNLIYEEAQLTILNAKQRKTQLTGINSITPSETLYLHTLRTKRKSDRLNIIKRHLGISTPQLARFELTNANDYFDLLNRVLTFEDQVIVVHKFKHPIFWDFDRFIHIFLRHYRSFYISSSTKPNATKFQYSYSDILRVIKIVIGENRVKIEDAIGCGKEFRMSHDHGYYYNGNYYTFRIAKDGKLMQFHPQS